MMAERSRGSLRVELEASCHGDGLIKHRQQPALTLLRLQRAGGWGEGAVPRGDGDREGDTGRTGPELGLSGCRAVPECFESGKEWEKRALLSQLFGKQDIIMVLLGGERPAASRARQSISALATCLQADCFPWQQERALKWMPACRDPLPQDWHKEIPCPALGPVFSMRQLLRAKTSA